jgi:hypothetical protein
MPSHTPDNVDVLVFAYKTDKDDFSETLKGYSEKELKDTKELMGQQIRSLLASISPKLDSKTCAERSARIAILRNIRVRMEEKTSKNFITINI